MIKVLTLACILAVAHHVAAQCKNLKTYSETFVPQCAQNDVWINWPNYRNSSSYYECNGVGKPVLVNCPAGQYFAYVFQTCVSCEQYIPAIPCSQLKTQNPPNCVPIQGCTTGGPPTGSPSVGTTFPTPIYPSSVSTEKTTRSTTQRTTITTASTTPGVPTPSVPTPSVPTPPTSTGTTMNIPDPPSPVLTTSNVPMPPTPGPTPPSVELTPPNIPSAPYSG